MNYTRRIIAEAMVRRGAVLVGFIAVAAVSLLSMSETMQAADPAPVNPPGPLPLLMLDDDGNRYEVFLPEEGGSVSGEGFSFIADPGDVPSATLVGIRMTEGGEASNLGMAHHRYTLGGNYYMVDAVNEYRITSSPRFRFRNPVDACVPMPMKFFANIVDVRLIATDAEGISQTVLNSGVRLVKGNLSVCGYVGAVPTTLAVGMEGSPGPAPPSPTPAPEVVLPETGSISPSIQLIGLLLILGISMLGVAIAFARWRLRVES